MNPLVLVWSGLSYPVVCTYLLPLETQSGLRCAHLCPRVHKELGEYSGVIPSPGKVLFKFKYAWERLEPPAVEAGLTEALVLPPGVNQGERGCTWISVQSGLPLGQVGGATHWDSTRACVSQLRSGS